MGSASAAVPVLAEGVANITIRGEYVAPAEQLAANAAAEGPA